MALIRFEDLSNEQRRMIEKSLKESGRSYNLDEALERFGRYTEGMFIRKPEKYIAEFRKMVGLSPRKMLKLSPRRKPPRGKQGAVDENPLEKQAYEGIVGQQPTSATFGGQASRGLRFKQKTEEFPVGTEFSGQTTPSTAYSPLEETPVEAKKVTVNIQDPVGREIGTTDESTIKKVREAFSKTGEANFTKWWRGLSEQERTKLKERPGIENIAEDILGGPQAGFVDEKGKRVEGPQIAETTPQKPETIEFPEVYNDFVYSPKQLSSWTIYGDENQKKAFDAWKKSGVKKFGHFWESLSDSEKKEIIPNWGITSEKERTGSLTVPPEMLGVTEERTGSLTVPPEMLGVTEERTGSLTAPGVSEKQAKRNLKAVSGLDPTELKSTEDFSKIDAIAESDKYWEYDNDVGYLPNWVYEYKKYKNKFKDEKERERFIKKGGDYFAAAFSDDLKKDPKTLKKIFSRWVRDFYEKNKRFPTGAEIEATAKKDTDAWIKKYSKKGLWDKTKEKLEAPTDIIVGGAKVPIGVALANPTLVGEGLGQAASGIGDIVGDVAEGFQEGADIETTKTQAAPGEEDFGLDVPGGGFGLDVPEGIVGTQQPTGPQTATEKVKREEVSMPPIAEETVSVAKELVEEPEKPAVEVPEEKDYEKVLTEGQSEEINKRIDEILGAKDYEVDTERIKEETENLRAAREQQIQDIFGEQQRAASRMAAIRGAKASSGYNDLVARIGTQQSKALVGLENELDNHFRAIEAGELDKAIALKNEKLRDLTSLLQIKGIDADTSNRIKNNILNMSMQIDEMAYRRKNNFDMFMAGIANNAIMSQFNFDKQWQLGIMQNLYQNQRLRASLQYQQQNLENQRFLGMVGGGASLLTTLLPVL